MQIAVFLNVDIEGGGFVAPANRLPAVLDLANAHVRIPQALHELRECYGFETFDDSPLHNSIRLFASFVARARRHQFDGNSNEAFLHYVIALELIFGDQKTIQRSVSERVGLATHSATGRSFHEQRHWIDSVYNLRSSYVHEGKVISDEAIVEDLYKTCEQCFRCLMRLQASRSKLSDRSKEALTHWLVTLDYLSKAMIAGKTPDDEELKKAYLS